MRCRTPPKNKGLNKKIEQFKINVFVVMPVLKGNRLIWAYGDNICRIKAKNRLIKVVQLTLKL